MCTEDEYYAKLERLDELTYSELCALKQHCIHHHGFLGLRMIEKALSPHLKERGF